jgi:methionyl-tRNA formyltransferase
VIRALTHPYPGAETTCNGESVLLWKAKLPEPADLSTTEQSPGTVLAIENNALHVRSGDGKVMILDFTGPTPRIGDQLGG